VPKTRLESRDQGRHFEQQVFSVKVSSSHWLFLYLVGFEPRILSQSPQREGIIDRSFLKYLQTLCAPFLYSLLDLSSPHFGFLEMNPRELVDYIRSGPAELVLDEPLRFRRRTHSNPCDFNEFLRALQSSETIRTVECLSHTYLGISEDEWVLLVKTLGRIRDI
jgi:hypothetical protein